MRWVVMLVCACGSSGSAGTGSSAVVPPAAPGVVVTASAVLAGSATIPLGDSAYQQARAIREQLAAAARAPHPVLAIAPDARADGVVVAIDALEAGGAERVDVRTRDGDGEIVTSTRPAPASHTPKEVDLSGTAAPAPPGPMVLSVLVDAEHTWFGPSDTKEIRIATAAGDSAKLVAALGPAVAVELAASADAPVARLIETMRALCPRFPAMRPTAPGGLTTAPTM